MIIQKSIQRLEETRERLKSKQYNRFLRDLIDDSVNVEIEVKIVNH